MTNPKASPRRGGVAPFGYRWADGRLVIDPAEAPIRKLIYELFLEHRRKKTVARILNELGHRTRTGSQFTDTTVRRLLCDSTPETQRTGRGDASVPQIVSPEVSTAVTALLDSAQSKKPVLILTGFAYCECGREMLADTRALKYVCRPCSRRVPSSDVEEVLLTQLGGLAHFDGTALVDNWPHFSDTERRTVIEQTLKRIVLGATTIRFDFVSPVTSSETLQHSERVTSATESGTEAEDSTERLLSEADAADFLGVSKMTVLRKRSSGEIGFFRIGSRVLYSKEKHLLPYLNRNERKQTG